MADWQTQAVASLPRAPVAKIGVFASNRFPELPSDEAMRRYGVMGDRIFYIDRDGSAKWEEPGLSDLFTSPDRYAASLFGPAMPAAGGFGGGLIGGAAGSVGGIGGSYIAGTYGAGGGAAAGEWLRQELAKQYTNENMSDRDRWVNTALSGAIGMSGYAISRPAVHALVQRYSQMFPALGGTFAQWPIRTAVGSSVNSVSRELTDRAQEYEREVGELGRSIFP